MALDDASLWFGAIAIAFFSLALVTVAVTVVSRQRARHLQDAREWGRRVMEAQDEERATIARDLHDGVIQELHAARLGVLAEREKEGVNAQLVGAIDWLRGLARGLHPAAVDTRLLREALADIVPPPREGEPTVTFQHRGDEGDFPIHTRRHLYRIAQQAVVNALSHAKARSITIDLDATGEKIMLTVTDDGVGMAAEPHQAGLGMRSMTERAAAIGGTLSVDSNSPQGSRIAVSVPRLPGAPAPSTDADP